MFTLPFGFMATGGISRNFTTLDSAFSMMYSVPVYQMAVGDTVEFKYLAPTATVSATNQLIGGDDTGGSECKFTMLGNGAFGDIGFDNTILLDGISTNRSNPYPIDGKFHTIVLTSDSTLSVAAIAGGQIGNQTLNGIMYDVVIKNSGGDIQRNYPINETWIGPSTVLTDISDNNQDGTAVNVDVDDSELFTFDGSVSPNTWTNDGATRVIEVSGT